MFSGSRLISKSYELHYPDGSKKHIGRAERDDLLLSGIAKQIGPQTYQFTGQRYTLHALSELSALKLFAAETPKRRFLPGSFIIEFEGKRRRELLETPESCALRLTEARP